MKLSIFGRAAAGLSLTPGERAGLRLVEGLAVSAGISGLQAVMPLLNSGVMSPAAIPWASVAHTFAATALGALGAATVKFFKAQGDPPVASGSVSPASPGSPASGSVGPASPGSPGSPAATVPSVPPIVGGTLA